MKILFDKIGSSPKEFEYRKEHTLIKGTLHKNGYHRVNMEANLSGEISLDCVRCGVEFSYSLDNDLDLIISDEVIETKDSLDILEFLDGVINIEDIVDSEINSLKSEYNYCKDCASSDEDFEVEF